MRSEVFIRQREKAYFLFLDGSRRLWPQSAPDQLFEPLTRCLLYTSDAADD